MFASLALKSGRDQIPTAAAVSRPATPVKRTPPSREMRGEQVELGLHRCLPEIKRFGNLIFRKLDELIGERVSQLFRGHVGVDDQSRAGDGYLRRWGYAAGEFVSRFPASRG